MSRIVISGGGTGGHIYPAIGIAKELIQLDAETEVVFIGGADRLESTLVPQHGFRVPANLGCRFSSQINMVVDTCCVQGLFRFYEIIMAAQKPKT